MKITLKNLEEYANRIGADFLVINERKYPDWPVTYEKTQMFDISRCYDWCAFIDADTCLSKNFLNVFTQYPKNVVQLY